ncbi:MAG: hypothetical protein ACXVCP_13450 [Bdellovibrio sp.]
MQFLKVSFLTILIFIGLPLKLLAGGSTVGNGGDLVACQSTSGQIQYKSLDYLLTLPADQDEDLISASSLEESISSIQSLMDEKVPELASSFRNYINLLWNEDPQFSRVWEKAKFGLISIGDEELGSARTVPDNCKEKVNGESKLKIVQAVIRLRERFSENTPKTYYSYVPQIIGSVEKSDALQISFLIFHEWLWDYSKNVERNRRINRSFHSNSFHRLSSQEIKDELESLGFVLPSTTTALYESQFCQATQSSMDELLMKKNKNFLGKYLLYRRSRFCDSRSGCGFYKEYENQTSDSWSGITKGIYYQLFKRGMSLRLLIVLVIPENLCPGVNSTTKVKLFAVFSPMLMDRLAITENL